MRQRLPLVLSAAALVVAVLGSTPVGGAAGAALRDVVPFARNAGAVGGIKASRSPRPGQLLPLGADRKCPAGVLPAGTQGPPGPQGPPGVAGLQLVLAESAYDSSSPKAVQVTCPAGKRALSWSFSIALSDDMYQSTAPYLEAVGPIDFDAGSGRLPAGWTARAQESGFFPGAWRLTIYAVCATA